MGRPLTVIDEANQSKEAEGPHDFLKMLLCLGMVFCLGAKFEGEARLSHVPGNY
jgi:hypothetical protein